MTAEENRTRLIGELVSLIKSTTMPEDARAAGLTLIGWLARRMPGEGPHTSCCREMFERAREPNGSPERQACGRGKRPR
jgi:hypothetical protein